MTTFKIRDGRLFKDENDSLSTLDDGLGKSSSDMSQHFQGIQSQWKKDASVSGSDILRSSFILDGKHTKQEQSELMRDAFVSGSVFENYRIEEGIAGDSWPAGVTWMLDGPTIGADGIAYVTESGWDYYLCENWIGHDKSYRFFEKIEDTTWDGIVALEEEIHKFNKLFEFYWYEIHAWESDWEPREDELWMH